MNGIFFLIFFEKIVDIYLHLWYNIDTKTKGDKKMKYYQTKTTCDNCDEEWLEYAGYDEEEAKRVCYWSNRPRKSNSDFRTEVRVYETSVPFEELDDDEQCCVLSSYDVL